MKTKYLLAIFLSFMFLPAFSQEKQSGDKDGKGENPEALLNSKEFVFKARRAMPSRGSSIDLTSNPNYVKFSPDMIESYMPFFGRAYSGVGYGNEAGLHFKGQPEVFTVEKKKRNYQVNATVRGDNDNYRIFLTVTHAGSATLSISSNNRETMSYVGDIGVLKAGL